MENFSGIFRSVRHSFRSFPICQKQTWECDKKIWTDEKYYISMSSHIVSLQYFCTVWKIWNRAKNKWKTKYRRSNLSLKTAIAKVLLQTCIFDIWNFYTNEKNSIYFLCNKKVHIRAIVFDDWSYISLTMNVWKSEKALVVFIICERGVSLSLTGQYIIHLKPSAWEALQHNKMFVDMVELSLIKISENHKTSCLPKQNIQWVISLYIIYEQPK